jgi:beta propeller repeat protein
VKRLLIREREVSHLNLMEGNVMKRHIILPIILISLFVIKSISYAQPSGDNKPPVVTNCSPAHKSEQVPLNNLISFNITDDDTGVDIDSVEIKVNNKTVYKNGQAFNGNCQILGKKRDYTIVYQSYEVFGNEQKISITITAKDYAGNVLNEYTYWIITEMISFGQNMKVNSDLGNIDNSRPVTVCDSGGNTWVVWQAGPDGSRDIYISKLPDGAANFESAIKVTNNAGDQCNPAIALDGSGKLYVVWQDNRNGNWDIYLSIYDGTNWSAEVMVNEPESDPTNPISNQINPSIVIDKTLNQEYVVWQDDDDGSQDIYIAKSSDGFATPTVSQLITPNTSTSDQVEPAIAVDSANTVYVVWTDGRELATNGTDIYGAASNNSWTNVAVVSNSYNQTGPVIAAESTGSILHLLWVDDTPGDTDIYYATSNGLSDCPLSGSSIIDEPGTNQLEPAIFVTGSTGNDLKVYACWQDWRNVSTTNPDDTDLYFVELSTSLGTNIFVGDGGTNSDQSEPAIGVCKYGFPYLVWTDGRNAQKDIYYAGGTFVEPLPVWTRDVQHLTGANWGDDYLGKLDSPGEINLRIPPAAFPFDCALKISASRIMNMNAQRYRNRKSIGQYEFGPSGIQFKVPINIAVAYSPSSTRAEVYWYDPDIDDLSQEGIKILGYIEKETVHIVHFQTRHFTPFILLGGAAAVGGGGGGGGGGGCAISTNNQGHMIEYMLPYVFCIVVLLITKIKDARSQKA